MIRTSLCDLLGIEHPILNAPMSRTAAAELAAAVSNAGGLGMIGGTTRGGAEWLRQQIRSARALTDRPFGVGFISSFSNIDELVQVALDERVSVINHSFSDPTAHVKAARDCGIRIFTQVQSLEQAKRAADAGVDAIIAQGGEAGGHTGTLGTMAFVPAVVDAVGSLPVLAAGGIADGRGLAAALMLGAVGVSMGTRFVASHQWGGGSWEQTPLLAAGTDDTIRTAVYDQIRGAEFPSGIADRVVRNAFNSKWEGRANEIDASRTELQHELKVAAEQGDSSVMDISGGEAVGLVRSLESARTIIDRTVDEAGRLLRDNAAKYIDPIT